MKQKLILLIFITHWVSATFGQCYKTTWLNPLPTSNPLYGLWMISEDTVFIGGDRGTLFRTTDGGANWNKIQLSTTHNIYSIVFVNSQTGFISAHTGNNSGIFKSTDGGNTWNQVFNGYNEGIYGSAYNIQFPHRDTGYVYLTISKVLKTIDGGQNWTLQSLSSSGDPSLYFVDTQTGFAGGSSGGAISYTMNGGQNWNFKVLPGFASYEKVRDFDFIDSLTGYLTTSLNRVMKTTDGGINWSELIDLPHGGHRIHFSSPSNGFILTDQSNNFIYVTTDSGNTWTQKIVGVYPPKEEIAFINSTGYIVSSAGNILKSIDNGQTWIDQSTGFRNSLYTIDNDGAGNLYTAGMYAAFKSTNNGQSWNPILNIPYQSLMALEVHGQNVWVAGINGTFRRSTNGGNTWSTSTSNLSSHNFQKLYFINAQIGFLAGENGILYRTTDGGINWTNINTNSNAVIRDIYFVNPQTGFAVGSDGLILRTTNGGNSWTQLTSGTSRFLLSVWFINDTTGFIGDENGWMLTTHDAGNTWASSYPGWGGDIVDIEFIDEARGYLIQSGSNGIIYATLDSGKTWQYVDVPTNGYLREMTIVNDEVFICGYIYSGMLFKISPEMAIPVVNNHFVCYGDSIYMTAGASPHLELRWFDGPGKNAGLIYQGDSLLMPDLIMDTVLFVSAYDSVNICESGRLPIQINVKAQKTLTASIITSADTFCSGEVVFLEAISNADTLPSYQWKRNGMNIGSDTSHIFLNDLSGADSLWVEITAGDACLNNYTAISVGKNFIVSDYPSASFSMSGCFAGETFEFINTTPATDSISFMSWSIDGQPISSKDSLKHSFNIPGNYVISLVVTNQFGCTDSAETNLNVPAVPVLNNMSFCYGDTAVLSTSLQPAITLRWYQDSSSVNPFHTGDTLTLPNIITDTLIYVAAYESVNACESSRQALQILVQPLKNLNVSISASDDSICMGETVVIEALSNASGVVNYQWKRNGVLVGTDSSHLVLNNLTPLDSIWVEISSNEECLSDSTVSSSRMSFLISSFPVADFNINDSSQCLNDNEFLLYNQSITDSSSKITWKLNGQISLGSDSVLHRFNSAGIYQAVLIVENEFGCIDSVIKELEVYPDPSPLSIIGKNFVTVQSQENYTVSFTPGSNYQWWINGGSGSSNNNSINVNWQDTGMGNIQVLEISADGCAGDTANLFVYVSPNIGLNETLLSGLSIYPNPAVHLLNVENHQGRILDLKLYDVRGKLILTDILHSQHKQIELQSLADGLYLLELVEKNKPGVMHYKVVIDRGR